jgi:predicted DNA-binding ribbon-helix-helix protein
MSRVKNHRICVHGHQTSLRLESELWYLLRRMAAEIGTTAVRLIECTSAARDPDRSLSSEIRVCIAISAGSVGGKTSKVKRVSGPDRVKIHDLAMEGIDAVLRKRGYPSAERLKAGKKP